MEMGMLEYWVGLVSLTCFANKVEFVYPPLTEDGPRDEKSGLPAAWENLPFLALPDGVHRSGKRLIAMIAEEDHSYFTLPPLPSQRPQIGLLYGVSCFRQVHVSSLHVNSEAYTRTLVQKTVCALTNVPLLGSIQARLSLVTRAYFDQGNFEDTQMLALVHNQLNAPLSRPIAEPSFYIGFHIGQFVRLFKRDFLVLFKLMLLEQKVLFNGTFPVSDICNCVVSLLSLVPGLLSDAHSKHLSRAPPPSPPPVRDGVEPSPASTLSPLERRAAFGLPLQIFDSVDRSDDQPADDDDDEDHDDAGYHQPEPADSDGEQKAEDAAPRRLSSTGAVAVKLNPLYLYICIRQIGNLREHPAYFAAASNPFFTSVSDADVTVHVDLGQVIIKNKSLSRVLSLTQSDRRFIDYIIQCAEQYADDGGTHWEGSDDWVRAQFTSYLESFFASLLTVGRIFTTEREEVDLSPVVDFNVAWAKAWLSTVNYQRWKLRVKRTVVSSLAAPVHPSGAPTDLLDEISDGVSGLSEKLASKMAEMELAPLREKLGTVKTGFMRSWTKLVTDSKANWEAAKKQWDARAPAAQTSGTTTDAAAAPKQSAAQTQEEAQPQPQQPPPPEPSPLPLPPQEPTGSSGNETSA
ncbi:uncharacterized protein ACA1_091520 [Acanthamoeba castellanii str. Neff]|uniref:UDENN domain-containing protein n=1 Tax=Acanthamoeba castellanii (strain ATCC 30010 / Neff) TaxID=1257118 RepID=L8GI60_ACACF|nr:uncharacterized protein ACA1_091520 [Acanthamoeba castellanii str. Neff]ELR12642.1 hypothetical protein ACA1_091520 [Acanthamoeba castellanii str. Neff]